MSETDPQTEDETGVVALLRRATGLALGLIAMARAALAQFGAAPPPAAYTRLILRRFVVPAEATVRRAILVLAGTLPLPAVRPASAARAAPKAPPRARPGIRYPVFCLTEPAPRARRPRPAPEAPLPRILFLDTPTPAAPAPKNRPATDEEEAASETRLLRRLFALERAYLNPWREARRYLRRCARDEARGRAPRRLAFTRIPGNTRHLYAPFRDILQDMNLAAEDSLRWRRDTS
ncbi:MAG: hypothetical protein C0456_07140 [Hyphomonas sp.]|uniref:hypothetical protein n=1 Tax=Hyphomonas sp. TaxID=87 RepID=UPI001D5A8330|nr:hypothetical protein [Hyphomonas sp.]MBA4226392.1 hypothetical protein [Hyphomonas sp.]